MSGRPDAAALEASRNLEEMKRMREIEEEILARAPESDIGPSLDRIRAVMELAGDPQRSYPSIHLTGTNGKTSTSRMIDSILRETGLSTGRFTSPHLHDIRERITLSGKPIPREKFIAAYEVAPLVELVDARSLESGGRRMNFFEVLVALAYAAFADAPVDVAIIEVGLGGSWDATNVIDAQVAVVTPVDLDHTHLLGDDVVSIAQEKSGIIKADSVTVSGVQDEDVARVLLDRVEEVGGARIVFEGNDFGVLAREVALGGQQVSLRGLAGGDADLFLPLHGAHQASNLATAVAAVESFLGGGEQRIEPDVLTAAVAAMTSPGRLEVVRRSPTVLVDAAHNPHGARSLVAALEESFGFTRL